MVINDITIKSDEISNLTRVLDEPISNLINDLSKINEQMRVFSSLILLYQKIHKGIEIVSKVIQNEINDFLYFLCCLNYSRNISMKCIKGLDIEKKLNEKITIINIEIKNNKDVKFLWSKYIKVKEEFSSILPNEINKCKTEMYIIENV